MTSPRHALVAGAGIGGLTAALALARAGLRVTLVERAPFFGEVGAGLQLSPNATRHLDSLGLMPRLAATAFAPDRLRVRSAANGAPLMTLPLGQASQARWGAPTLCIHRADLQSALLAAVAETETIDLRAGAAAAQVRETEHGVELETAAGDMLTGDVLICADGVHSTLRPMLGLGAQAAYSGRTAWRALVPAEAAPVFAREPETNLWLGSRAHLVHYPLRAGSVVNVVAITEEPLREAGVERFWAEPGDARRLLAAFADWSDDAQTLLRAVEDWRRWPLFDGAPLRSFVKGRAALLGDAAHPMLPFFAQGASQAIEDAAALGLSFRRAGDVARALADYDRARVKRAARVQAASRKQGAIYHLNGIAAGLRDIGMRALPPRVAMARFDWLYAPGRELRN